MSNSEQNDEECDARDDDSSNADGLIKNHGLTKIDCSEENFLKPLSAVINVVPFASAVTVITASGILTLYSKFVRFPIHFIRFINEKDGVQMIRH